MFELKPLSTGAIPAALAKAERYRLLNESGQAESICQDVLAVDPDNQEALVMMILAVTDQFRDEGTASPRGPGRAAGAAASRTSTPAYYGGSSASAARAPRSTPAARRSPTSGSSTP